MKTIILYLMFLTLVGSAFASYGFGVMHNGERERYGLSHTLFDLKWLGAERTKTGVS